MEIFFSKQKTADELRISDWRSDVCASDLDYAQVELGDGSRARLRLADYQAYARIARRRLEDFVENPAPTRPIPCADCALCRWGDHCESVWQAEDSLFNVANITRPQVRSEEHTSELQSLMRISYAVFCLKKKK